MKILLLVALTVFALVYFWFWWKRKTAKVEPLALENPPEEEFMDLNDRFLKNEGQKGQPTDLARVFHPEDLTLLRALLDSEGIESYVVESRMGELYPLSAIPGFADSTIAVYRSDWEEARRIVEDYLTQDSGTEVSRPLPVLLPPPQ